VVGDLAARFVENREFDCRLNCLPIINQPRTTITIAKIQISLRPFEKIGFRNLKHKGVIARNRKSYQ
jgi:hypothetical protein